MLQMRTMLLHGLAGLLALAALAAPAQAHPHIWVTVESTVVYDKGGFTGFQHKWTFDEFYSAMAVEGLDKNKDGKYDREELAELAQVNVTALKDFGYFTFPTLGGQAVKIAEPRDYWLEYKDGILALYFTLPLETPVLTDAKGFSFAVYDPSFFIAFDLAKTEHPMRLSEDAPKNCALKMGAPEKDQGNVSALGESLAAISGVGLSFAKSVSVECAAP
jgi:ABC-type uncharacterized transport system substrate-binding protein